MRDEPRTDNPRVIAVVGGGPKGASVLERICANAPACPTPITVHIIDPDEIGSGRVWRDTQSQLLQMNSRAESVTMFTDDTVVMDGPPCPGPSLWDWIAEVKQQRYTFDLDEDLRREIEVSTETSFVSRRLQGAYLRWFYRRVRDAAPPSVTIIEHRAIVESVTELTVCGEREERYELRLNQGTTLRVHALALCIGHSDVLPSETEGRTAVFAERHNLRYWPPGYTADLDFSSIEAGSDVAIRGMGLAAIDAVTLLTAGRGGTFVPGSGGLTYRPSGEEPHLILGSRRGVPYRAKRDCRPITRHEPPRFARAEAIMSRLQPDESISFTRHLLGPILKEMSWAYYREFYARHPARVTMEFDQFSNAFATYEWDEAALDEVISSAIAPADTFDARILERPMAGRRFDSRAELQSWITAYLRADYCQAASSEYSPEAAAMASMLGIFRELGIIAASGRLDGESQLRGVDRCWFSFFSFFGNGPPRHRVAELLALQHAGIVEFCGPDMTVCESELEQRFVIGSPAVPGTVAATTLIDARLPEPSFTRSANDFINSLRAQGMAVEEAIALGDRRVGTGRMHTTSQPPRLVDAGGQLRREISALGPHTSQRAAGAFSRPRSNAPGFRESDAVARGLISG